MTETTLFNATDFPRSTAQAVYREGDILLFNTQADHCLPSEYTGRYHVHILCHAGKAQFSMMEKTYVVEADDWVIWQIGSEIYDALYSSDFDADFLLVARNFLIENNPETVWATKGYVFIKENPVFRLDKKRKRLLQTDFDLMRQRLSESNIFRREILGRTMQIFLFDLWNVYEDAINRQEDLSNVSAGLFHRFMDLVRQYSTSEREVVFYADKLCVSPKYLSEIVKKGSGRPASYWINGYATQEIVAQLKKPDMTLAEISERLGFYNPAHFSRFVKKMLGVSPSEYRNELDKRRNKG